MPSLLEQFILDMSRVGLVAPDDLHGLLDGLASEEGEAAVQKLADRLVARGKLTRYQAAVLHDGQADTLVLSNYLILEKLGAGGMGTVFKARHRRMKRTVAIKVLPRGKNRSPGDFERFQREVEAIASLNHPNIVTAYDADEAHIGQFLVMEYIEGSDLDAVVKAGGPLPVREAVDATLQAARALEYAHREGIVHRDIKPANLLRDARGTIKVADLGLARLTRGLADTVADGGLTQAGTVFGTVDYMSPEQALDSKDADRQADIYSLGCSLHFLLMGRPVYHAETLMGKLLAHRDHPIPSLRKARADIPEPLDAVFQRMVAKAVTARYPSMTDVIRDLTTLLQALEPTAPIVRRPVAELTVQLVEPSKAQSLMIGALLRNQGIAHVDWQSDGHSALEAMRQAPPDVVLCALHLADMTGLQLLEAMRIDAHLRTVGFLLVSSEHDAHHMAALRQAGAAAILPKPFQAEQLQQALAEIMA
ncbi:MAG TPA: serine/threonine-protein kinase [Isosphaeraceae bacterium]|jgi:serine/threonine protein kinase|nr:serine/threonine-protein kinase [Isosphaeraceae bacterium]